MQRRKKGNFCPLCVWWCILFLFCVDAVLANNGNSSSAVSQGRPDRVNSETTMEKGMRPFFDMVKSFLDVVQPNRLKEQTWLNITDIFRDNEFHIDQFEDWQNWADYLIGFMVCAAVGILFVIVMPIVGCVFCCCRCMGKCGGRTKPHDPKHAGCKRTSYCTLLLLLNTVTLAGVVCAFISNEILYEKLRNENNAGPVGKIVSSLDQVDNYANNTADEIEITILVKFDAAKVTIIEDVKNTANEAVEEVLGNLNATSLINQTRALSRVVNQTRDELTNVATQLTLLSTYGTWLAGNLTAIADEADSLCGTSASCGNYDRNKYRVNANFSSLNDLSSEAQRVAESVDLGKYIGEAEETIATTKNTTTQSVDNGISRAIDSVTTVRQRIESGIAEMRSEVKRAVTANTAIARSDAQSAQKDITKYSKYQWYGGLGVSCLLLLVVVLYKIGVLFGICGERPGLGAQCCNTGTGARFLMAGVGFTFLFSGLIMLVCIVLFLTGGPVYSEVCRYFTDHNPQELQPFSDAVMQFVDENKQFFYGKNGNLGLVEILNNCKNNRPIYNTLWLDNFVNLTDYTDLSPLKKELDNLKAESFNIPDITIVTSQLNQTVKDFATSGLDSVNFAQYYAEVNKNLTVGDLHSLATNLRSIARQGSATTDFKNTFLARANQLDNLDQTIVVQMRNAVRSLNNSLRYLETEAAAEIQPVTAALLNGLQTAQDRFNEKKTQLVRTQLDVVIQRVLNVAEEFIQDMLRDVDENIGKCRPLYDSFYTASDAVCVDVLEPLNGFWFSLGWCLFFFIPCLIFAVKLAGLYRREQDEKDFDDPTLDSHLHNTTSTKLFTGGNYILYGNNQDTIPLTSSDRGRHLAYPSSGNGLANSAYHQDRFLGPRDRYAPPPYGPHSNGVGSGEMTPPPYARAGLQAARVPHLAHSVPYPPGTGTGAAPYDAY